MIDLGARLRAAETAYRTERNRVSPMPSQERVNDLWRAARDLRNERELCTEELTLLRIGVDDTATGSIHFLGTLDGGPVLFCWRFDEPRVDTWRTGDEAFSARRPLPEPVLA